MYVCEDMLGCVHVKGCPYFSPPCQHSGLTESWKWKDRAILLAVCLARFPLSLCHSGSASESLTEMLWRLLCHISSAAGRLTDGQDRQEVRAGWQVGSNEAQIPCVYLPLCALESTGQEGGKKKWVTVWWCMSVNACQGGRKRCLQLFLFVCFYGLWFWGFMLLGSCWSFNQCFQKKKRKSLWHGQGLSGGGHPGPNTADELATTRF